MTINSTLGPDGYEVSIPAPVSGGGAAATREKLIYPGPTLICHRAGAALWPENSMDALNASYQAGFVHLEVDVQNLSGGGLGCIHNATVDYTTSSTGNVADLTAEQFSALSVNLLQAAAPAYLASRHPLFGEVLGWAVDKDVVLWPEIKVEGAATGMLAELMRRNYPATKVVVQTTTASWAADILSAGYSCMIVKDSATTGDVAGYAAAGFDYLAMPLASWTADLVAACVTGGITSCAYTINRKVDYQTAVTLGIEYLFTDDPLYIANAANGVAPVKSGMFELGMWMPGTLGCFSDLATEASRGVFTDGGWGYPYAAQYHGCIHGSLCPINGAENASSYTIAVNVRFDSVGDDTRWVGVHINEASDAPYKDAPPYLAGHHILLRRNGAVTIYRTTDGGVSASLLQTVAGTPLTLGAIYALTVTVSPTAITATCNGVTNAISNSDPRGGFFHLGRNGCAVVFSGLSVA